MTKYIKNICLDIDAHNKPEKICNVQPTFYSQFVNKMLRKELGLEKK